MTNIPDLEADKVTAAQLAVNVQVEKCELTRSVLHLQPHPKCPDVLELERGLLTDDLALVPWLAMPCVGYSSHDGLPSS